MYGLLLDQPVGSAGWLAFAWCVSILLVFVPLSVSLYRRVAAPGHKLRYLIDRTLSYPRRPRYGEARYICLPY